MTEYDASERMKQSCAFRKVEVEGSPYVCACRRISDVPRWSKRTHLDKVVVQSVGDERLLRFASARSNSRLRDGVGFFLERMYRDSVSDCLHQAGAVRGDENPEAVRASP